MQTHTGADVVADVDPDADDGVGVNFRTVDVEIGLRGQSPKPVANMLPFPGLPRGVYP